MGGSRRPLFHTRPGGGTMQITVTQGLKFSRWAINKHMRILPVLTAVTSLSGDTVTQSSSINTEEDSQLSH